MPARLRLLIIAIMNLHRVTIQLCSAHLRNYSLSLCSRQYSTKKDRTPAIEDVNTSDIDSSLMEISGSKWTVENAANIGIRWDPTTSHPAATLYGSLFTREDIMKDTTTTAFMKQFLDPIWGKKGPSGDDHFSTFAKDTRKFVKGFDNELFVNFMSALADVCDNPNKESYTRQMIIELCRGIGLHNTYKGLHTKIEHAIVTNLLFGRVSATPELVIGKQIDDSVLYQLIFSEAKKLHPESRARGEGQIVGETTAAMLYNWAFSRAIVPIISVYVNGYFLRLISCTPTESYVNALMRGNLSGITAPKYTTYPAYDHTKAATLQGFNLLKADDRAAAAEVLIQIRHNLICSCPAFANSTKDSA